MVAVLKLRRSAFHIMFVDYSIGVSCCLSDTVFLSKVSVGRVMSQLCHVLHGVRGGALGHALAIGRGVEFDSVRSLLL